MNPLDRLVHSRVGQTSVRYFTQTLDYLKQTQNSKKGIYLLVSIVLLAILHQVIWKIFELLLGYFLFFSVYHLITNSKALMSWKYGKAVAYTLFGGTGWIIIDILKNNL